MPYSATRSALDLVSSLILAVAVLSPLPAQWAEAEVLTPPTPTSNGFFGQATAVSGEWAIIGEEGNDARGSNAGAAHLYRSQNGGPFGPAPAATLYANPAIVGSKFGRDVALSGDVAVVTSLKPSGATLVYAYVFERDPTTGTWMQVGAWPYPGDTALCSTYANTITVLEVGQSAMLHVHRRQGFGVWRETQVIPLPLGYTYHAIHGTELAVASLEELRVFHDHPQNGFELLFQTARPTPYFFDDLSFTDTDEGKKLALVLWGSPRVVQLYTRQASGTSYSAYPEDRFLAFPTTGYRAARADGNLLVVGTALQPGRAVSIYEKRASVWSLVGSFPPRTGDSNSSFGQRVAIDCGRVLVSDFTASPSQSGKVYVMRSNSIPPISVRVSFKVVRNASGVSAWSQENIAKVKNDAAARLQRLANVYLVFTDDYLPDPGLIVPDSNEVRSWIRPRIEDKGLMERMAEADPCRYRWRTDAINVYLVDDIPGFAGVCSFAACPTDRNDIILLSVAAAADSQKNTLAHEIGHYFNLLHTHAKFDGSTCACPSGSGDCVADTPDDINPAGLDCATKESNLRALGYPEATYRAIRYNVMSYHCDIEPDEAVLTCGQVRRMRDAISRYRSNVVVGSPIASILGVTPSTAIYPGPTSIVVSGANLPVDGTMTVRAGDQVSAPVVAPTPGTQTASFADPVSPGNHCVCLQKDGQVVAYLASAAIVAPFLVASDVVVGAFNLTFTSTGPNRNMVMIVGTNLSPIPLPGLLLYTVQVLPIVTAPFVTDGNGRWVFPINFNRLTLPAQADVQGIEAAASLPYYLTNPVRLAVPQ